MCADVVPEIAPTEPAVADKPLEATFPVNRFNSPVNASCEKLRAEVTARKAADAEKQLIRDSTPVDR